MNTQHPKGKPDFFVVLVLVVMLSFGLTLSVQIAVSDLEHVVDSQSVKTTVSG
jgi:hypothetical protein